MASQTCGFTGRMYRCAVSMALLIPFLMALYRINLQYFPLFRHAYDCAADDNYFHEGYISSMIRGREADVWRAVYCKNF